MTEQDLKYQDLKKEYEALKKENERLRFSNSFLEKELKEQKDHIADSNKMVVTNADRIRSMTDEELIAFIKQPCKTIKEMTYPNRNCVFRCDECIEEWLKEKVE